MQRRATYLNREDVQSALHIRGTLPVLWQTCSHTGPLNYTTDYPSMIPYYDSIFSLSTSLRILLYSGDTDIGTCPHMYTQLCMKDLKRKLLVPWHPWEVRGHIAGYSQVYDGYSFVTVKGAGHEAPQFAPLSSFELIRRFVIEKEIL